MEPTSQEKRQMTTAMAITFSFSLSLDQWILATRFVRIYDQISFIKDMKHRKFKEHTGSKQIGPKKVVKCRNKKFVKLILHQQKLTYVIHLQVHGHQTDCHLSAWFFQTEAVNYLLYMQQLWLLELHHPSHAYLGQLSCRKNSALGKSYIIDAYIQR